MQIASGNARNVTHNDSQVVREFVHDDTGALLSPDEDPEEVQDTELFLEELVERQKENDDEAADNEEDDE